MIEHHGMNAIDGSQCIALFIVIDCSRTALCTAHTTATDMGDYVWLKAFQDTEWGASVIVVPNMNLLNHTAETASKMEVQSN